MTVLKTFRTRRTDRRSGQAIIFLMVVMFIGLLVVLWNYDLHNIVSTKIRIDNAGDAAALSAARWQGITLNMVGEMNLIQAAYACDKFASGTYDPTVSNEVELLRIELQEIADVRSRLSLNGPLMGYVAAQSAAFLNLKEKDDRNREDDFSSWLSERAQEFQTCGPYYEGTVEEPYPGGWLEYGNLLASIADNKMVVDCSNPEFFLYYDGSHILLDPNFYEAVASGHWCYFKDGEERDIIDSYETYSDWGPLPPFASRPAVNSEYFGLDLLSEDYSLNKAAHYDMEKALTNHYENLDTNNWPLADQQHKYLEGEMTTNYSVDATFLPDVLDIDFPWHYYAVGKWLGSPWPTYPDFPFEESWQIKEEYDYRGADAVVDCYINAENITPNMRVDSDWIYWHASAKPFGYLPDPDDPELRRTPVYFGSVLPAFHDVRLIHTSLSSSPYGMVQPGVSEHFYKHLLEYEKDGLPGIEQFNCWYCRMLEKWEDASFRQEGAGWLEENQEAIDAGDECAPPPPSYNGGGGSGGGAMGRG
jgi:hypothetical protein